MDKLEKLTIGLSAAWGVINFVVGAAFAVYYGGIMERSRALVAILGHRSSSAFLFAAALLLTLTISKLFDAMWESVSTITRWTIRRVMSVVMLVAILFEALYVFGVLAEALLHITLS